MKTLTEGLSVAPQISPADVAGIAEAGYRSIICNRPDGEAPDQPSFAEIAEAAAAVGIACHNLPIVPGQLSDDDVDSFGRLLEELPAPVLAFCRTGTRSTTLWCLAQAGSAPTVEILGTAASAGYDLSALTGRIEALAAQR
jgi:sulfide:quinone oxidoreductase